MGETLQLEIYEYEPPDIFRWISDMVSNPKETKPFPTLQSLITLRYMLDPEHQSGIPQLSSAPGAQTKRITHFFTELMKGEGDGSLNAVRAIVGEGLTRTELDQLPFGISVPLREAIWKCRRNPSPDLNSDALSFIGRNDLAELASKCGPGYYIKSPSKETGVGPWAKNGKVKHEMDAFVTESHLIICRSQLSDRMFVRCVRMMPVKGMPARWRPQGWKSPTRI
jgi:hypothetical protein